MIVPLLLMVVDRSHITHDVQPIKHIFLASSHDDRAFVGVCVEQHGRGEDFIAVEGVAVGTDQRLSRLCFDLLKLCHVLGAHDSEVTGNLRGVDEVLLTHVTLYHLREN